MKQCAKRLSKQGKKKAEDAKVGYPRNPPKRQRSCAAKKKPMDAITEDVMKKDEKTIQDLTDKFCKEIDDLFAAKEKEIMTV